MTLQQGQQQPPQAPVEQQTNTVPGEQTLTVSVPEGTPAANGQIQATTTDTSNGFLVGVEPATPPAGSTPSAFNQQQQQQQQQQSQQQPQPQNGDRVFTADDVAAARQEEKDKLYTRISSLEETLKSLAETQKEKEEAEAAALAAQEEADRKAREAEMSAHELIEEKTREWEDRFNKLAEERDTAEALLRLEQEHQQVIKYRDDLLQGEVGSQIAPELRHLVTGSTIDEINDSAKKMVETSANIFESIRGAQLSQMQQNPGASLTGAPPVGPMENSAGQKTFTLDEIKNMDNSTYAQYREQLQASARMG